MNPPGKQESQFLFSLKFQNTLPNAPSGPYFKKLRPFAVMDPFKSYRISSLEKGHVWQPNFGPDLGINFDLVDQESILFHDTAKNRSMQPESYLHETSEKTRTSLAISDKPWWLRETTYISNDVFRAPSKASDDNHSKRTVPLNGTEESDDASSAQHIERTFETVEKTVENLKKQGKRKLIYSLPLLPLQYDSEPTFSIVRFDEDPAQFAADNGENQHANKRINSSIITNFRLAQGQSRLGRQGICESTLVAPLDSSSSSPPQEDQKEGEFYDWVKDYTMDVQSQQMEDSFLFILDEDEDVESGGSVSFAPYAARIEMKKMGFEESTPHECYVSRK